MTNITMRTENGKMEFTNEQIQSYDWNAPVSQNPKLAVCVLNDALERRENSNRLSVGPLSCYETKHGDIVPVCPKCGMPPKAWIEADCHVIVGCHDGCHPVPVICATTKSANDILRSWTNINMFKAVLATDALKSKAAKDMLNNKGYEQIYCDMPKNEYVIILGHHLQMIEEILLEMQKCDQCNSKMQIYVTRLLEVTQSAHGMLR